MKCPICQGELTFIKKEIPYPRAKEPYSLSVLGYECRVNYYYLTEDYPVSHYTFKQYFNFPRVEFRYLFPPFVIYADPDKKISKIQYLTKDEEDRPRITDLCTIEYLIPDCARPDKLIERLYTYLIFS